VSTARFNFAKARLRVEPRGVASPPVQATVIALSFGGALVLGAIMLWAGGHNPVSVYRSIIDSGFGSWFAFSQTLTSAAPVILTAAATVIVFRASIFSIGMDGQLLAGAIASSGVALEIGGSLPGIVALPLVLAAGIAGGLIWSLVPALARAHLGTNEVLTTLMMNFIATSFVAYLVIGTSSIWRDSQETNVAEATPIPSHTVMPHLFQQADIGILIASGVALLVALLMRTTRKGFELRVIGNSVETARYAGIKVARNIVFVMCLSGALCGLAGAVQVTSVTQSLDPTSIDPGLGIGFTGIVVAALARLSIVASIPVAIVMGALLNAGLALQLANVPSALVVVLQGALLLLVIAGQFFFKYRLRLRTGELEHTS
jgi:general nucleoside transport system permease protein